MKLSIRLPSFFTSKSLSKKIVLVVSVVGLITIFFTIINFFVARIWFQPDNAIISNLTPNSFTVVWTTDIPTPGVVKVNSIFGKPYYDDRDVLLQSYKLALEEDYWKREIKVDKVGAYYTHHVTVRNLKPDSEYKIWIGNGRTLEKLKINEKFSSAYAESNRVFTLETSTSPTTPHNAYGYLFTPGFNFWETLPESDGIVLMDLLMSSDQNGVNNQDEKQNEFSRQNMILSSVTSVGGSWVIDYSPWESILSNGSDFDDKTGYQLVWAHGKSNKYQPEFINNFSDDAPMRSILLGSTYRDIYSSNVSLIKSVHAYDCGQLLGGDCFANDHYYPEEPDPGMRKACSCTTPDGVNHWIGHGGTCYEISLQCSSTDGSGSSGTDESDSNSDQSDQSGDQAGDSSADGIVSDCNEANLGQECHQQYREGNLLCNKYGKCFRNSKKPGNPIECSWGESSGGLPSACKSEEPTKGPCILGGKEYTACKSGECATPCRPGYSCTGGNNDSSCCTGSCLRIQETVVVDSGDSEEDDDGDEFLDLICCKGPRPVEDGEEERVFYYEADEYCLLPVDSPVDYNSENIPNHSPKDPCGDYSRKFKVKCASSDDDSFYIIGESDPSRCSGSTSSSSSAAGSSLVCCSVSVSTRDPDFPPHAESLVSYQNLDAESCPFGRVVAITSIAADPENPCDTLKDQYKVVCEDGSTHTYSPEADPDPCSTQQVSLEPIEDTNGNEQSEVPGNNGSYLPVVTREDAFQIIPAGQKCESRYTNDDGKCKCATQAKSRFVNPGQWCPEIHKSCPNFFASNNNVGKVCNLSGNTCEIVDEADGYNATGLICTGPQPGNDSLKPLSPIIFGSGLIRKTYAQSVTDKQTVTVKFDSENGLYYFETAGQYKVTVNGRDYLARVQNDSQKTILYIDTNGNGEYDQDSDQKVSKSVSDLRISKTASAYKYKLRTGFNFVAFPFVVQDENLRVASNLIKYINSSSNSDESKVYSISIYHSQWKIVAENSGSYDANDFQIIPGRGYVIKSNGSVSFTLYGNDVIYETERDSAPVRFNTGWNLVSVYGSKIPDYSAESFIDSINTYENGTMVCDNVSYWASEKQRYSSLVKETRIGSPPEVYGTNFNISPMKGYFVRVLSGSGEWNPDLIE